VLCTGDDFAATDITVVRPRPAPDAAQAAPEQRSIQQPELHSSGRVMPRPVRNRAISGTWMRGAGASTSSFGIMNLGPLRRPGLGGWPGVVQNRCGRRTGRRVRPGTAARRGPRCPRRRWPVVNGTHVGPRAAKPGIGEHLHLMKEGLTKLVQSSYYMFRTW
jgi:hypothetical protein